MLQDLNFIQTIVLACIPILFAITVHEVAHGYVANLLGDPTARMLGRLSLNPIKHIDPIGTIVVPMVLYMTAGLIFGWAKPVPVTYQNLKKQRRDLALVALAGPLSNFLMAILWTLVLKLAIYLRVHEVAFWENFAYMAQIGIYVNLVLVILNMLPIPPLDGAKVVSSLLPGRYAYQFEKIEPYGIFVILALVFLGVWQSILVPALNFLIQLLMLLV